MHVKMDVHTIVVQNPMRGFLLNWQAFGEFSHFERHPFGYYKLSYYTRSDFQP